MLIASNPDLAQKYFMKATNPEQAEADDSDQSADEGEDIHRVVNMQQLIKDCSKEFKRKKQ